MRSSGKGCSSGLLRNDCKKALSVLCHQKKARLRKCKFLELTALKPRTRKRRWLATTEHQSKYYWRKLRMPKFMFESLIREDDVSFQNVKDYIERNSIIFSENQERHHLVKDYLRLFDLYYTEPAKFYKLMSSALNNLKINVLNYVAQIITENKIVFERTRAAMKKVVEENLPEILYQSDSQNSCHSIVVKRLSLILRDPVNFRKHLTLITPVTPSLLSSIRKILEELDNIPSMCLVVMDRKISGVRVTPDIFTNCKYKKERLIKRLRKQCNNILLKLLEGDELPKPLAKALSVISLYKKQVAGRDDIPTTEFFPFTPEAEALQMGILKAIWLLPEVRRGKLKILQHLLDPSAKLSRKTFRFMVNNYLMEYLFETCEVDVPIPESFLRAVTFINRNSSPELDFCKKNNIEEDLETILNISSQFKQIVWESFQDHGIEKYMKRYDTECGDGDSENDDIVIDNNKTWSVYGETGVVHHVSFLDVDAEVVDESEDFIGDIKSPYQVLKTKNSNNINKHTVKFEKDADSNGCQPCSRPSIPSSQETACIGNDPGRHSYDNIQSICDETSLLAHKLIGCLMEKFQAKRSRVQEEKGAFLVQAVEELVPFIPKRYLESMKAYMDPSQL